MPLQDLFLLAILDGIKPARIVNTKSMKIKNIAPLTCNLAICATPVIFSTTTLIGTFNTSVINMPNTPLINPIINVSALNRNIRNYTNHDA